ncbi:SUMF1/EgtB/PvdO family nonheme iron enzyme [Methanosarcina sp. WWM596]|uniref:formylglycine-generating enzyme family protein n=1 Tax=Methanosarcina sp. WWM596 TaxID=1434103 RepID=UPI0012E07607
MFIFLGSFFLLYLFFLWHDNYNGAPSNGSVWEDGNSSNRILRDGNWNTNARNCRSANRNKNYPGSHNNNVGFRLLSSPPLPEVTVFTDAVPVPRR